MDDGGIISSADTLVAIWNMLLEGSPKLGLELNPTKCEWSWLDPGCIAPCPIHVQGGKEKQIELVPTNEIQMLRVPLGSDEKAAAYIEKKLLGRLKSMVDRLADFDDIQSAFFLLRTSFSIVRATHFMRTTPLKKWKQEAAKFDKQLWDAAQSILGLQIPEQIWKQACLTPRLGGLGLRRVVDHAEIAFSASWHEAKATCRENWTTRDDTEWSLSQKSGSYKKDEDILKNLIVEAPNPRERQRLNRLKCEHSGAWVCAVPSTHDGRNFQVAVAMRLGLPVLDEALSCSLCVLLRNVF
jgi:hypothetical protein